MAKAHAFFGNCWEITSYSNASSLVRFIVDSAPDGSTWILESLTTAAAREALSTIGY